MVLHVAFGAKPHSAAVCADKWFLVGVDQHVHPEILLFVECFRARKERTLVLVCLDAFVKVDVSLESGLTLVDFLATLVGTFEAGSLSF